MKTLRTQVKDAAYGEWAECRDESCGACLASACGADADTIQAVTGHDVSEAFAPTTSWDWIGVWHVLPSCAKCTAARELYEWAKAAPVADLNLVFGGAA
jgi:hypothetical protein